MLENLVRQMHWWKRLGSTDKSAYGKTKDKIS
jgi:hypothetical protein